MAEDIIGIIGGSGLGDALGEHINNAEMRDIDTPFGKPSGPVMLGRLGSRIIAFINRHGRGHKFSPSQVPYAANIFALKLLGVKSCIATAASGSLRERIKPKDLVVVDQIIDKTFKRKSSFFDGVAAVHCEMAEPYCEHLRSAILSAAKNAEITVHKSGTYVCMEGPQFSTRAESLMHIGWGGDLIGMTAMPEAKLAREAQMSFALIALASDYDCWRPHNTIKNKQALLAEIIDNLNDATNNAIRLIKAVLQSDVELVNDNWPSRKSLELAIWTKPEMISDEYHGILKILQI